MKLLKFLLAVLFIIASPALAGWLPLVTATVSQQTDNGCSVTSGTVTTFTAKNFGAVNPTRVTVVSINWDDSTNAGTASITAVSIGGNSAVRAIRASGDNQNSNSEIWYVLNPTGTSGNIVITSSTNIDAVTIGVYSLIGYGSPQVTGTGTTTANVAYTNKTVALAAASRTTNVSTSLSSMINDFSSACGANLWGVHASNQNNGNGTLTTNINPSTSNPKIAMALWSSCPQICDPYFNNVVFLASFEQAQTSGLSYFEQSLIAATVTFSNSYNSNGASQSNVSALQFEYGASSARSDNGTQGNLPANSAYYISDTNTTPYTIEYSYYQPENANNYSILNRLPVSGNFQYLVRHTGANWDFFYSPDGTALNSTSATGGIVSSNFNRWTKYAICKNTSGLIRMFINGVQVQSATPANSIMFHSTGVTGVNSSGNSQIAYMDNARITAGVCRYDATSYTTAIAAFPTQ